ncbi:RNA methyltransferase [Sphaerotilus uruguayifluvii]|uniref:23S rRNA (Adenine2503-C2)-methyltransferase n=1 Tax=Sphaerotilus uruguayifluvii TaxID=2735897 RepID=A0ABX2G072_9BURK|nr:RNA methyltransferase [Leptothrix sp. C29]NRT55435.1 23S rRNA (adenine2503-C2)-methyltransferase [Leptothrix sp. C29]
MRLPDLTSRLHALGAGPSHVQRVLRHWAQAHPHDRGAHAPEHFYPKPLLEALPALREELAGLARLQASHPGEDGSARLLVRLGDGQMVESVLLPAGPKGGGVCVSTQVGCAVGCRFCMTGQGGLVRQLGSAEIVAQVALARQQRPGLKGVRRVVFMGMGEPAHNLDEVMDAIELLGTAGNIGHKELVFSTVGDLRVFERLPQGRVKPALALSLHTTRPALRAELLPRAPALTPAELVRLAEDYARATQYPIQYQWTLLEGVNDSDDELEGIAELLAGKYAMMNLIPFNSVEGSGFRRPSWERAAEMARWLNQRGVLTRLRRSAGQDVDAGCGQLRARARAERPQHPARKVIEVRPAVAG